MDGRLGELPRHAEQEPGFLILVLGFKASHWVFKRGRDGGLVNRLEI